MSRTYSGYSVRVDGLGYQWADDDLDAAAEKVAAAHRDGSDWTVRRRTGDGMGMRVLTKDEADELIARVAEKVAA